MARSRKVTTDHDGDGNMGGSLPKGGRMATKKTTKRKPSVKMAERNSALDAAAADMATVSDPLTGAAMVADDKPTRAQVKKAQALEEQFAAADAKGSADPLTLLEMQARRAITGL